MRKLHWAALVCVVAGGMAPGAALAQGNYNPCYRFTPNDPIGTLAPSSNVLEYPEYPEEPGGPNVPLEGCGALEVNASAAGIIGMPGSPFFTTVFQRMMAPAGDSGAPSTPLGYAQQPNLPDTSPFADLDRMIEGRNADIAAKAPPAAALPPADPSLVWVRGAGRWGFYNGLDGGPGATLETGAIFAGVDLPVTSDFRFGVAGGWSDSQFQMEDDSGTLDATAWHASAYATAASGNWRSKAIFTYEYYDMASERPVGFGPDTAYASYNADHIEALGEISYVQLFHPNAAIEPYASVGVSWVDVDGFTEQVNGTDFLTAEGQQETWPYTLIGLRLVGAIDVNGVLVNPMIDLGWRHVFGDTSPSLLYDNPFGESFAVAGMPIAEDSLVVQAGFDAAFQSGWRTSLKYKGDIADTAQQHTVTGGVAVPF